MEAVLESNNKVTNSATMIQKDTSSLGGKYLTFLLAGEEYGLEILKVREIIGVMDVTPVPQTCNFVEGVINLRGKVIPIINLRNKFSLEKIDHDEQTCIIVVDVGMLMGIVVDTVQEVHNIPSNKIEPAPRLGSNLDDDFIQGMGKVDNKVKILLDIDKVLNIDELVLAQDEWNEG